MATNVSTLGPAAPEDALRFTFVEMLFALAVSQVAMSAADLASLKEITWDASPAISHLILSLVVIATSWVGWRRSQSPGAKPPIASIFGIRFMELLIDVALVIVYFMLVKSVEIEQVYGNPVPELKKPPSAMPEAGWISVIFAAYALWDLIADVFSPGCLKPGGQATRSFLKVCAVVVVSVASSVTCLALSLLVFRNAQGALSIPQVVVFDLALLFVVLLFRVLKTIENPLSEWLGVDQYKAFFPARPPQTRTESKDFKVIAWLASAYILCLVVACRFG